MQNPPVIKHFSDVGVERMQVHWKHSLKTAKYADHSSVITKRCLVHIQHMCSWVTTHSLYVDREPPDTHISCTTMTRTGHTCCILYIHGKKPGRGCYNGACLQWFGISTAIMGRFYCQGSMAFPVREKCSTSIMVIQNKKLREAAGEKRFMGLYRRDTVIPFRQVPVCHYGNRERGNI